MAFWQKVFRTWTRHVLQGNPRAVSDAPRSRPRHIRRPPKRSSIGIFVIFSSPSVRRPPFSGNMGMIPHEADMHPHPFEFSNTSCLSGGRRSPDRRPVFPRRTGVRRRLCAAPPRHHVPLRRERGAAGAFALLPKARPPRGPRPFAACRPVFSCPPDLKGKIDFFKKNCKIKSNYMDILP